MFSCIKVISVLPLISTDANWGFDSGNVIQTSSFLCFQAAMNKVTTLSRAWVGYE